MALEFRNFVTFDADFPEDSQWGKGGIALVPGGKGIAQSLRDRLQDQGFSCTQVGQHSFYGWAFDARNRGVNARCLLQFPGPWLLTCDRRTSFLARLVGKDRDTSMRQFLATIEGILHADKRFSNIRWHSKSDYEHGKENRASRSPC